MNVGKIVLCYEPDQTKAKVLYDAKILGVYEVSDKRGRKTLQYKVHFQGWSSSWDRKVNADFILKDTPENRQLQRELAEKAKLQLGAYLYRKERNSKKRSRKLFLSVGHHQNSPQSGFDGALNGNTNGSGSRTLNRSPLEFDSTADQNFSSRLRPRGISEDNFSSGSTIERPEDFSMKERCDVESDSYCSSVESFYDEDRVLLRISERLRQHLENDGDMIKIHGRQLSLPATLPAITILENFVRWSALKMVLAVLNAQVEPSRRRTSMPRTADKKEREFDKIVSTTAQLKEVADGLRIYFDFTVADYLLYKEEKDFAMSYLSEDYLSKQTYTVTPIYAPSMEQSSDKSLDDCDRDCIKDESVMTQSLSDPRYGAERQIADSVIDKLYSQNISTATTPSIATHEESQRRKLRSHNRVEETDASSSLTGNSLGNTVPLDANMLAAINMVDPSLLKDMNTTTLSISTQIRDFLHNIFSWHLLPSKAKFTPSMVFGAVHLARLLVKLPEFLNASVMSDEKLRILLQHLESFANYLECRSDWFCDENYFDKLQVPSLSSVSAMHSAKLLTQNAYCSGASSVASNLIEVIKSENVETCKS